MKRFDRPRTHEDRAMTLCELDDDLMEQFIESKARKQQVDWLNTMLDMGLFDLSDQSQDTHNWMCQTRSTSDRLAALMGFLKETHRGDVTEDPEYGQLPTSFSRMRLEFSQEMRSFFSRFCDHLCAQLSVLQGNHPEQNPAFSDREEWNQLNSHLATAAARAMVGACALDMPETLAKLASHFPEAQKIGTGHEIMGNMLHDFPHVVHSLELMPRCFAMLYSNRSCMEVLSNSPGGKDTTYSSLDVQDGQWRKREAYNLLQSVGSVFPLLCEPSAFGKALELGKKFYEEMPQEEWLQQMEMLLEGEGKFQLMTPYLIAYEHEGYFERLPTASAEMACKYGHAGILERLQGEIDWMHLAQAEPLLRTAERGYSLHSVLRNERDRFDNAMAAFCQRAIEDGAQDCVLRHEIFAKHDEKNRYFTQPVTFLVQCNFNKTLGKMLDAGLSSTEPPLADAFSPLELAVLNSKSSGFNGNTSTEGLLRAHSARSTAHDLLGQMDVLPFSLRPV